MKTDSADSSIFSDLRFNAPLEWDVGMVLCEKYRVKKYLGEGGFASVWQIRHLDWNMDLAVKRLLKKHLDNTLMIDSFLNECLSWIELGMHPNITSCCYVEKISGVPCVFAEYVDGGTLHDWIKTEALYQGAENEVVDRILDLAIQFACGLHHAHSCGMVHQDVKPSNVLLTRNGIVRVSDFGLIRAKTSTPQEKIATSVDDDQNTILAAFGGYSRMYCSPEQGGGTEMLTRRTDIYSWAVSVLHMFAGQILWPSGSVVNSLFAEYVSPENNRLRTNMPAGMIPLLKECLEHDAADRIHDFSIIIDRLKEIYRDTLKQPFSRPEPGALEMPASVLNNQCLSLLELGSSDAAAEKLTKALSVSPNHPEAVFNNGLINWRRGKMSDADLEKSIQRIAGIKMIDESYRKFLCGAIELERGDYTTADNHMSTMQKNARYKTTAKLYRNWIQDNRKETFFRKISGRQAAPVIFKVVPGGQYVIALDNMHNLALWQLGNGRLIFQYPDNDFPIKDMACSSEWAALSGNNSSVSLISLKDGRKIADIQSHSSDGISTLSASLDGSYLLTGGYDGKVFLWKINRRSGQCQEVLLAEFDKPVSAATFSRDSKRLAVADEDKNIAVWSLEAGELKSHFKLKSNALTLVFVNDEQLAAGTSSGYISFHHISDGKETAPRIKSRKTIRSLDVFEELLLVSEQNGHNLQLYDMHQNRCLRNLSLEQPTSEAGFACGHLAVWAGGKEIILSSLKTGPRVELLHSIPYLPDDLQKLNLELAELVDKMGNALKYNQYESAIMFGYKIYESPLMLPSLFFKYLRKVNEKTDKISVHSIKTAFCSKMPGDYDTLFLSTSHLSGVLLGVSTRKIFITEAFTADTLPILDLPAPVSVAVHSSLHKRLFLGGSNEISIFDMHNLKIAKTVPVHADKLMISGNDEYIMAFSGQDEIIVWDIDLQTKVVSFHLRDKLSALAFIPGSDTFYYAGESKNCLFRSSISNKDGYFCTDNELIPHAPIGVRNIFIDATGTMIISAHADNVLRVWTPGVTEPRQRIPLETEVVAGVIAPDAPIFVAGCINGDIIFINLKDEAGKHYTFPLGAAPVRLFFSQTGLFLYILDNQGKLHALSVNWRFRYNPISRKI